VQAVAAAHDGAVSVRSAPGRTVFTLRLPALGTRSGPGTDGDDRVNSRAVQATSDSQPYHSATTSMRPGI
jgi:two-component system OmpR family sensor kinase